MPDHWDKNCEEAFSTLNERLTAAPVHLAPDPEKPYVIETDASDFGIGAVLLQESPKGHLHPIAFESKKVSSAERNYPAQERELLANFYVLRSWRRFVDGPDYVVYTDHNPLQYLRTKKDPARRLIRWLTDLELYDPIIKYKPGKDNVVPDALSRRKINKWCRLQ